METSARKYPLEHGIFPVFVTSWQKKYGTMWRYPKTFENCNVSIFLVSWSSLPFPGWARNRPFCREMWQTFCLQNGFGTASPNYKMVFHRPLALHGLHNGGACQLSSIFWLHKPFWQFHTNMIKHVHWCSYKKQRFFVELPPPQEHSSNCLFPGAIL